MSHNRNKSVNSQAHRQDILYRKMHYKQMRDDKRKVIEVALKEDKKKQIASNKQIVARALQGHLPSIKEKKEVKK
jgi:hypothetical protein